MLITNRDKSGIATLNFKHTDSSFSFLSISIPRKKDQILPRIYETQCLLMNINKYRIQIKFRDCFLSIINAV